MNTVTDDLRIKEIKELITPAALIADVPITPAIADTVAGCRTALHKILHGGDDRLIVVMGPCSIHDVKAAMEYANKLKVYREKYAEDLEIVMRVYFEKPRTTVGWKGLINDPNLDGSFEINKGLRMAREVLLNINGLGLPAGTEFLDMITPQYIADLVSWGAIGARTTESQVHRELVSGLPMPVGFKNGTDGGVTVAINAMKSAAHPHHHMGVSRSGAPAMITTAGNPDTHLVLRGGRGVTNYDADSIGQAIESLHRAGVSPAVMVDCSHDNACKQAERQLDIAREVMAQKDAGNGCIRGLMLESFLEPGRQDDGDDLTYGCSITDPCIGWTQTEALIRSL